MKDATTQALGEWIARMTFADLGEGAVYEARRDIYNWFGLVLHAGGDPAVRITREWIQTQGGSGATAVGGLVTAPVWAALVNGQASHVEDFDDTHHATIIHPTAPIWPAVLAIAEQRELSGADALTAFVVGVDVALRVGLAVFPSHYDRGYHITATAGALGAAAAVARLLGLASDQIEEALGLASTAAAGLKGTFGSMAKALHPGQAAMRGIIAGELAARGFTAGRTGLESKLGFCQVLADRHDLAPITADLGRRWLITENSIKPFACGVVAHPAIDGILQLRAQGLRPAGVEAITLRVHPRVAELTAIPKPQTGLEAKFSVQHSVAAALIDGRAGPRQYTDARVKDPAVVALRDRVRLTVEASSRLEEAEVVVTLRQGGEHSVHVPHTVGSLDYPLSDEQLDDKVRDLLDDPNGARTVKLREQIYSLESVSNMRPVARRLLRGA